MKKLPTRSKMISLGSIFLFALLIFVPILKSQTANAAGELEQVAFLGEGKSEGSTLIVTFMPDIPCFLVIGGDYDQTVSELGDIKRMLPRTIVEDTGYISKDELQRLEMYEPLKFLKSKSHTILPDGLLPETYHCADTTWETMFVFLSVMARDAQILPKPDGHNSLSFKQGDPLFSSANTDRFRFKESRQFSMDKTRVMRLCFDQLDESKSDEKMSIYIDLHADFTKELIDSHFVVHAVRFYRGESLIDGFYTQENTDLLNKANEKKEAASKKRVSSPKPPNEPERDEPSSDQGRGASRSSTSHMRLNSGYNGGNAF